MKINKVEPFDINRLLNDFQSGSLERIVALPDFGTAHAPHVDLTVRAPSGDTVKYRIYDTVGASNLLSDFGPSGCNMIRSS